MSIAVTRLTPDRITGEGYDWQRLGYIDDQGWVMRRWGSGEEGRTDRVGFVDASGFVYDADRVQVGRVDSDGYVYDRDRNRIARVDPNGRIYDRDHTWIGDADTGANRYGSGWLAKAAGAGLLLMIVPEGERGRRLGLP